MFTDFTGKKHLESITHTKDNIHTYKYIYDGFYYSRFLLSEDKFMYSYY